MKNEANISFSNEKIDLINKIADHYLKCNIDSAIFYSKKALRLSSSNQYNEGKISSLNKLAFAYYIKNNEEKTRVYAKEALEFSRKMENNLGKAQACNVLGLNEWKIGAYPKAVDYYLKALDFATLAENKFEIAKSNNYLGLVYWKTGNYPKSIDYFYTSLELKQELNDNYEVALTLNNLSNISNEIGDYQQAIQFALRALEISEQLDSKYTLGRALGNLGISYLKTNETSKALEYLEKALSVKRESGEVKGLAYTLIDVGNIYFQTKDFITAQKYYDEALSIMTSINDAHGLSIVLNKFAKILIEQKRLQTALMFLDKSNGFAKRENLKENIKENYFLYSKIYEIKGLNKLALTNYKYYSELKDSLVNENINSRIKELNINYETNQKEKENELLKQSNTIQSLELEKQKQYIFVLLIATLLGLFVIGGIVLRYNYLRKTKEITEEKNKKIEKQKLELKQLNATKDKFFSILAHDLKNPFQTILGYSNLLSTDFDKMNEEEKANVIVQINNVSKSSYQLLENLLSWANTQTGRIEYSPKEYNLEKLTRETVQLINVQAERKFQKIEVRVDSNVLVYTDRNIFSTILRNLLTNAVKFSKINGTIIVDASKKESDIILKVEDNGSGIKPEMVNDLFTLKTSKNSEGTASESGTGLGLVICKEFVEIYD
ncbi:MAG: tetratricopeptide repeat-containing sensor histidine kinase, partial [Melioribacteraceae bacterium]|nr:tetratricopeptide repeat-containing sensor histidine kinase [Melioribacteraceae bacterium]